MNLIWYYCLSFPEPEILQSPKNATLLIGHRHTLHCRASGNARISWQIQHDGLIPGQGNLRNLHNKGNNYRILRTGNLRFRKISISNSGYYRCVARNEDGEVFSEFAYIEVQGEFSVITIAY